MQVRLKDVMDYITGIITQNAVTASLESCIPQLLASAAADMAMQTKACLHKASLEPLDNNSTSGDLLSDHSRMSINTLAEELADSTVTKVCCYPSMARRCLCWNLTFTLASFSYGLTHRCYKSQ